MSIYLLITADAWERGLPLNKFWKNTIPIFKTDTGDFASPADKTLYHQATMEYEQDYLQRNIKV